MQPSLDLSQHLRDSSQIIAPELGELWRASPNECVVIIRYKDFFRRIRESYARLQNKRLHLIRGVEHASREWVTVFVKSEIADPRELEFHARPGLLLGNNWIFGRIVIIPSSASKPKTRFASWPTLTVDFPEGHPLAPWSRYEFWGVWSIDLQGKELIQRVGHLADGTCRQPYPSLLDQAQKLLSEMMGLSPWTRPVNEYKIPRFSRREFVRITFVAGQESVPCLVVSPDELSQTDPSLVVTLRTIPYRQEHEELATAVPLPANLFLTNDGKRLTVSLTLVRGVRNTTCVQPYCPGISLSQKFFDKEIQPRLEDLYGYQATA